MPISRRRCSPSFIDEIGKRSSGSRGGARLGALLRRRAPATRTGGSQESGPVKALTKSFVVVAGEVWIGGHVEYGIDVVVHTAALSLGGASNSLQQLVARSQCHLSHAFMVAGMQAPREGLGPCAGRRP